ncbi:hypothetical protein PHISCL_04519 [Aspergillus sclerotialis]|uniref:Uncharacterized protein n=1 Tax=Aspergillus sclerotialis TaxID=2070753 RepID=A0A3A2ZLJ3_9EURO|nr:hypothetical protein PHISCL_04519 [Aspergillus sclerotialis]
MSYKDSPKETRELALITTLPKYSLRSNRRPMYYTQISGFTATLPQFCFGPVARHSSKISPVDIRRGFSVPLWTMGYSMTTGDWDDVKYDDGASASAT